MSTRSRRVTGVDGRVTLPAKMFVRGYYCESTGMVFRAHDEASDFWSGPPDWSSVILCNEPNGGAGCVAYWYPGHEEQWTPYTDGPSRKTCPRHQRSPR